MKIAIILMIRVGIVVLVGPLVTGFIQKVKARLQCRQGASVLQPYRDLVKLFRKGTVQSDNASGLFRAVPVLVFAATATAAKMVPIVLPRSTFPIGDAILLVGFLALARFLSALGALDAGGAFGGMGASREMTLSPLLEPVLLLVFFSVAVVAGTTDLGELAAQRGSLASPSWRAPDVLALVAMLIILIAESGRIPVDNPDTHLELTMIHEGMLLEHSGPGLGLMLLANHTKQLVVMALVGALFFPFGMTETMSARGVALAGAALAVKVIVLSIFLALVESSYAKLRFFRVPHFLGMGFLCAFLALALRLL